MSKDHVPTQPQPSASRRLKAALGFGRGQHRHQRRDDRSLKARVSAILAGREPADSELKELCQRWRVNKAADPHKPPLHVGATRKTKGSKQGSKS